MPEDRIIVDLLRELREESKDTREVLNKHTVILSIMQKDVCKNTEDLEEHILGVRQAGKRLDILEKPGMVKNYLFKVLIGSGSLSGSTYGIYKLWEIFFG